ncbi:MAG: hypothetical protein ACYTGL_02100 [Planctomycetota bacterium]|jgi:hypothetical protein
MGMLSSQEEVTEHTVGHADTGHAGMGQDMAGVEGHVRHAPPECGCIALALAVTLVSASTAITVERVRVNMI